MDKPLTGARVLAIAVGAFAVIIGVNLVMAFQAVSTFPGLEVKNSYVASQTFEGDRAAQEALGWTVTPEYDPERKILSFAIRDRAGNPARVQSLEVLVGRRTHVRDDRRPEMAYVGGFFQTGIDLAPGKWLIHLTATAPDGTLFRQRLDFRFGVDPDHPDGAEDGDDDGRADRFAPRPETQG
ncbi:nitrogen fixation protein FixH [Phaeovulum vinaykumarii]|uniref:Nitrogen fixation protein FixH n=1 Tax=Phaeovulum vinaykumarii TaxID=407234 RepID=A0A1N7KSN9_9RHOB|nr:FixH family protein [Phaeovulum vinaykumarii]SIS64628.1 Nitrogen fixation protein FixH [Phaeovulum vinaykumarii]SOC01534.1 nitrogen fixation protein FixH [Phaeovulum vinaykumarii]